MFCVSIAMIFISFSRTISTHVVLAREVEKEKVREKVLDLFIRNWIKRIYILEQHESTREIKKGETDSPYSKPWTYNGWTLGK